LKLSILLIWFTRVLLLLGIVKICYTPVFSQIISKDTLWVTTQATDTFHLSLQGYQDSENTTTLLLNGLPDRKFEPLRYIRILNLDTISIIGPQLISNRKGNWRDFGSVVQEALRDVTSPRDKALAMYSFLKNNRVHWTSPLYDYVNPLYQLCAYGYGFCDDTAISMAQLVNANGYSSREWALHGHFVSEINMGDGLKILDADIEVFYPDYSNHNLISRIDLLSDRFLGKRIHHFGLRSPWNLERNTWISNMYNPGSTPYQFSYNLGNNDILLLPNETLSYTWDPVSEYHHAYDQDSSNHPNDLIKHNVIAHAQLDLPIDVLGEKTIRQCDTLRNAFFNTTNPLNPGLTPSDSISTLVIQVSKTLAFPLVDLQLQHTLRLAAPEDTAWIYASFDGIGWYFLERYSGPISITDTVSGSHLLHLDSIGPIGTPFFRLELKAPVGQYQSGWDSIRFIHKFQVSRFFLPQLKVGDNEIQFHNRAGQTQPVAIEVGWQESYQNHPPIAPQYPLFPVHQATPDSGYFTFKWTPPTDPDGDAIQGYHFQLSETPDVRFPLAPNFDRYIGIDELPQHQFRVEVNGFLNSGQTYYWRVRARDQAGNWSPWSNIWSFTPTCIMPPQFPTFALTDTTLYLSWSSNVHGKTPHKYRIYMSQESAGFYPDSASLYAEILTPNYSISLLDSNYNYSFFRVYAIDSSGEESLVTPAVALPFPYTLCPSFLRVKVDSFYRIPLSGLDQFYTSFIDWYYDTAYCRSWVSPISLPPFVLWNSLRPGIEFQTDSAQQRFMLFDSTLREVRYQVLAPGIMPAHFSLLLNPTLENRTPTLSHLQYTPTLQQLFQDTLRLTDGDYSFGDTHQWQILQQPQWTQIQIQGDHLWVTGTPQYSDINDTVLILQITDSYGVMDTFHRNLHFQIANHKPLILSQVQDSAWVGIPYVYSYFAHDPDTILGDHLTWQVLAAPNWLQFDTLNSRLFGVPDTLNPFTTRVTLTVTDLCLESDTQRFEIHLIPTENAEGDSIKTSQDKLNTFDRWKFWVQPNPSFINEPVHLVIQGSEDGFIHYSLQETTGKKLLQGTINKEGCEIWDEMLPLHSLPGGLYILNISIILKDDHSTYTQTLKISRP